MLFNTTDYLLIILLGFSVFYDLKQKRIPNFLTFPAMLLGLFIYTFNGGWSGFLQGFAGFGIGIAVFFIPFALGGMGAGDVKLMGAIGALKGLEFILYTTVFTALLGGIMALAILFLKGQLYTSIKKGLLMVAVPFFTVLYLRLRSPYFKNLSVYYSIKLEAIQEHHTKRIYLPYGVAIAIGALIVLSDVFPKLIL